MLKQFYFIFVITLLSSFALTIKAETDCNAVQCNDDNCQPSMQLEQCETLLKLYNTTNGDSWTNNTNWNDGEPNNFALIMTDNVGNVLELNLEDNYLTGYLPDLSGLTSVTKINLHSNSLTGEIPDLSGLTNLTQANLRNNKLTGPIPNLTGLAKLEKISFYHNQLCGQIPDLTGLDSLQELDLSYNQLSGPVPNLSSFKNLRLLGISGNKNLCRIDGEDYGKVEYAVANLPICSASDEYYTCSGIVTDKINVDDDITSEIETDKVDVDDSTTANPDDLAITPPPIIKNMYTLQVNITGDGKVTATGINCGSDCQEEYVENTFVTLNATPNSGSIFTGWSDTCSRKLSICQVTMKDFYTISAYFEVINTAEIPLTEEVVVSNGDLEFIGLQGFYQVGEIVKLDLAEHITTEPVYSRLDLWIGLEDPNGLRYYMTELPLQPFSFYPQPFRNGITDYELLTKNAIYPLLYFEVPPGIGGDYKFFAVLSEADTGLNDLLFTQNSSTLTAKTTLGNTINPSVLPYAPERLTMFMGEDLELTIDSETTFDTVLNSCTILDTTIVQIYSAISDINNTVSCYLRALNSGQTVLTTTDRYGNLSETVIVVIKNVND